MFESYQKIMNQHKKLPLKQERKLIHLAQQGVVEAQNKLLCHLIGFFVIRVKTTAFPSFFLRYGEDIIQDCVIMAVEKIKTYNLEYKNKFGELQPLHFSTYIWKSVTGLIYSYKKHMKEIYLPDISDNPSKTRCEDCYRVGETQLRRAKALRSPAQLLYKMVVSLVVTTPI